MLEELHHYIQELSKVQTIKGHSLSVLSYEDEVKVASRIYDLTNRRIKDTLHMAQLEALKVGVVPARYIDNVLNLGIEGQIRLLQSKVVIVGVGRLGSHIVENLARMGVGHLTLIDEGQIDSLSLNSQSIALPQYLNVDRTTVMSIRVNDINAGVRVENKTTRLTKANAKSLIEGADLVVSSSNVTATHAIVSEQCQELSIPFVYGALNGWKGYVCSILPSEKTFSSFLDKIDSDTQWHRTTVSYAVAIVAGYQASEISSVLVNGASPHSNQMMVIDIESKLNRFL